MHDMKVYLQFVLREDYGPSYTEHLFLGYLDKCPHKWHRIGTGLARIGMDWPGLAKKWIRLILGWSKEWPWYGICLALDWNLIGTGLAWDWSGIDIWLSQIGMDCQELARGLANMYYWLG